MKIKIIKGTKIPITGLFSTSRSVAGHDVRWVWQTFKANASSPAVVGLVFYLRQWPCALRIILESSISSYNTKYKECTAVQYRSLYYGVVIYL